MLVSFCFAKTLGIEKKLLNKKNHEKILKEPKNPNIKVEEEEGRKRILTAILQLEKEIQRLSK